MQTVEYVCDDPRELTAKQLYDRYAHELPLLVKVSTGFYGNREETTFSTGQVLRLHDLRLQQRALVHDETRSTLSVPLDYPYLFYVGKDRTEELTIREVIERHDIPVGVTFVDKQVRLESGGLDCTRDLRTLRVIKVYEEKYFLANTVSQGTLLQAVLPIPLYLTEVKFHAVTGVRGSGIRGGGQEELAALLYHSCLSSIDFSLDHSDKEMVQLSQKHLKATDNIYHNIDTNIYINVSQVPRRPTLSSIYSVPSSSPPPTPTTSDAQQDGASSPPPLPARPPKPPLSSRADSTYEIKWNQSQDADQYEPVNSSQAEQTQRGKRGANIPVGKQVPGVPQAVQGPSQAGAVASELMTALQKRQQQASRQHEPFQDPASNRGAQAGDTNSQPFPFGVKLKPTQPKAPQSGSSNQPARTGNNADSQTSAPVVDRKKKSPGNNSHSPETPPARSPSTATTAQTSTSQEQQGEATYSNDTLAIVGPLRPQGPSSLPQGESRQPQPKPHQAPQKARTDSANKDQSAQPLHNLDQMTKDEVKQLVEKMKINDVQQLLTKLNMNKYREIFRQHQVDGVLLQTLSADDLRTDFGMTGIEINRLRLLITQGHVPK